MEIDKIERLGSEELLAFLKKNSKHGAKTLEILGKDIKFISAVNTDVGFELTKDLINMYENLSGKILTFKADESEKSEFKVVAKLLNEWCRKINNYNERIKLIKKESKT